MTLDPFFLPRMMPIIHAPELQPDWALFLDLDDTLLDFEATPSDVVVAPDLVSTLKATSFALDGALAIVSGRLLPEVDSLLAPLRLPGAGEHGATIRMPDGSMDEIDMRIPFGWVQELLDATASMKGVMIERKIHGVVAHFRNAPQFETQLRDLATNLIANATAFEIIDGKMSIEIHPRTVTKARMIDRLMASSPFAGRVPVFVGDDVTDLGGFNAVERLGGIGLDVSEYFAGRPEEVREWLRNFAFA